MPTQTKYKAKPVWWNTLTKTVLSEHEVENYRFNNRLKTPAHYIRFDSQHEFKVYLELVRMYGEDRIIRQHKLEIIPPCTCYPKGKTWRVDFAITGKHFRNEILAYVEAKGAVLNEFKYTLSLLEVSRPLDFLKLRIVFVQTVPTTDKIITAIKKSGIKKMLTTLPKIKKLPYLP